MDPIDMNATDLNCECLGLSRLCLMESAGKSLSDEISKIITYKFSHPVKVALFTGSGGNGGDCFVAARYLLNRGFTVEIYSLYTADNIKSKDAKANFDVLLNMVPRISRLSINYINDLSDFDDIEFHGEYVIVDGILGTGIKGKLRPKARKAIEIMNEVGNLKVAVDVPSGLDPLTGEVSDIAFMPDYTITFHRIKTGVKIAGEDKVGNLVTCDIGIPMEAELFVGYGDLIKINKRGLNSHKGLNGKVLIVGGSKDYSGAPAIAGMSAISSGADLVYVACPESASLAIKSMSPNLIVKGLNGDYLNLDNLDSILELSDEVDSVLLGPGATINDETGKLFNVLVHKIKKPIVLDADALKLVDLSLIKNREDLIVTPHLFEFKSFFKSAIEQSSISGDNIKPLTEPLDYDLINEQIETLQSIAKNIKGTVVLKGKYDLIMQGNRFKINKTGNPGMTVGGTGDALSGISTSLLAQGLNSFDAGSLAVYLNGRAGDLAMNKQGYGFSATDIIQYLGALMANIIK
ncbi:bifunctional ADP-dependent NAD(P)H-hydrate dehydratase/NAD(P)H-hydrate epimerase [Methanobrevibacter sp. AbM4]|uniref:bifunctional ADP-dependent NAD(P)H-hydrate dehydratase/NAD(P)H-hydrate epimerase n=1 Tax=Methanobrevibacter sp. AbM4 TaxID=224719 RepID=UPI000334841E|nr:bifunctional ADP-dependent NAD(P)H-hydrate dehydratase/NAD(P)H-hydrate epimerase [Methanobrevibacter sp. AbM4]AGN17465.1 carbohydrate kinase [Methanobrevibacter sp. AbM4]